MSKKRKRNKNKKQQKRNFGGSLERYAYKRIAGLPIKWEWIGIALAGMVIVISIMSGYFKSSTLFGNTQDIIRIAAEMGDYKTAQKLVTGEEGSKVLGANTELEELAYPEKKIQNEINKQESLLTKYPGSRDLFLSLAQLYREAGKTEIAKEYWEAARVLDPNNPIFK